MRKREPNAKLTEQDVRDIRRRYATGKVTQEELALDYGMSQACINDLILRKSWKKVA